MRVKLYSGDDQQNAFGGLRSFEYDGKEISLAVDECRELSHLQGEVPEDLVDKIIDEIGAQQGLLSVTTKDDRKLYYTIQELKNIKLLIVVSADEIQPGLYQVMLEGVWEI